MRFEFTDHAIRRYQERHAPEASWEEANAQLAQGAASAVLTKNTAKGKARCWILPTLGDVLAIGDIHRRGPETVVVVFTILPARYDASDPQVDEGLQRYADQYHQQMETLRQEQDAQALALREQEQRIREKKKHAPLSESAALGRDLHRLQTEAKLRRDAVAAQRSLLALELRFIEVQRKALRENAERNLRLVKDALRLAVGFLKALPPSLAGGVLAEIAVQSPGLITDAFVPARPSIACPDCVKDSPESASSA